MFLKYKVDIPVVPGKLVRKNRGGHTYIEYTPSEKISGQLCWKRM